MSPAPWLAAIASLMAPALALAAPGDAQPTLARPSAQTPAAVTAWLLQHTSIAPGSVVSVGDEYIVAVLSSRALDPTKPHLLRVEIRAEMTDPDTDTAAQMRSLSATLDINCNDQTSHFIEVRTFAGVNLTGALQVTRPAEGWVRDPKGSYFEDIDAAVCQPSIPGPLIALNATPPAPPPRPERTLSAPLRPAEAPDGPSAVRRAAARPASPRPAPPQPAAARSGSAVQIAAATSEAKAEDALAALRSAQPALMSGLATRIEKTERGGVTYFRALVFGFGPSTSAAGFCRTLEASGRACIVR